MEKRTEGLEAWCKKLEPYIISKVAPCQGRMYGVEDFLNEARIMIWKLLRKYPDRSDGEFNAIFRVGLRNMIANRVRQQEYKYHPVSLEVVIDLGLERNRIPEEWYRLKLAEFAALCRRDPILGQWMEDRAKGRNRPVRKALLERARLLVACCSL
jgi:DNA-directed RNA polymerase specialized sigma24 family protein